MSIPFFCESTSQRTRTRWSNDTEGSADGSPCAVPFCVFSLLALGPELFGRRPASQQGLHTASGQAYIAPKSGAELPGHISVEHAATDASPQVPVLLHRPNEFYEPNETSHLPTPELQVSPKKTPSTDEETLQYICIPTIQSDNDNIANYSNDL